MDIAANLASIHQEIETTCRECGRNPAGVRLVAVAKTKSPELVEAALAAGQAVIGESYVQELVTKTDLIRTPAEWHFIGHLQSNKAKYLVGRVALIHSVDRLSLAREIDKQWGKSGVTANILLQVNLAEEESKSGTTLQEAEALARAIAPLQHVRLRGLMTLPPYCPDPEEVRPYFRQLRQLAEHLSDCSLPGVSMDELSMGMSHDFRIAIEEGATLVRIGTAIFGERQRRSAQ
jgi:pyridoxal phosphate enzyme (YggS family)